MIRKPFALLLAVLCAAGAASAAGLVVDKGIFVGVELAGIHGTGLGNAWSTKTGMMGGFALTLAFGDAFALQPEIYYIQRGAVNQNTSSNGILRNTMSINILQVPVLAKLSLKLGESFVRPYVIGGASVDLKIGKANMSTIFDDGSGYETQVADAEISGLRHPTYSWIAGAGVDFRSPEGRLTVEARYSRTLGSIVEEGASVQASAICLTLGYFF